MLEKRMLQTRPEYLRAILVQMEAASLAEELRYRDWYLDILKGGFHNRRAELMGTNRQANRAAQLGVKGQPNQTMLSERQRRRHPMPYKGSPEEGNHST